MLDATDLVRLIGDHVALRAKGREFVCLCPFHDDHTPSMYVVPHKQIYHCFACGAGGNAIDFMMRYHGMTYPESLRHLAERAGIELTPYRGRRSEDGSREEGEASREDIASANGMAQSFFRSVLNHAEHGRAARELLARRGISPEMVEEFGIGAAPDRWDGLVRTIEAKRLPIAPFVAAGLVKAREGGGYYDALRNRLIFTIHDQVGRAIAFGGRRINDEDEPKYLNSPETALFHKSSTLFALKQAYRAIQQERTAVITEGYTDAIACHQAGIRNVVATLGTALTERHASILRRFCDCVVLLFDSDEAGQLAADRALDVFFREPVDVKVGVLPGGKDPDEVLKSEGGVAKVREAIASARDLLEFRFARMASKLDAAGYTPGSIARARAIEEDLQRLVDLGLHELPPIRKQTVIRKLAKLAHVGEPVILQAIPKGKSKGKGSGDRGESAQPALRRTPSNHAEHVLACLLAEPRLGVAYAEECRDILKEGAYSSPPTARVAARAAELFLSAVGATLADMMNQLDDDAEARETAAAFAVHAEHFCDHDAKRLEEHLRECVRLWRHRRPLHIAQEPKNATAGASAPGGELQELNERLHAERARRQRHGGNPTALPRPTL